MTTTIHHYIEYLQEANRIIQGLSKNTGKPADHIQSVWKDTEKEVLLKHKYGVTDMYKTIGKIVRGKMGLPPEQEDKDTKDKDTEE